MRTNRIDTIDQWNILSSALLENEYIYNYNQYSYYESEGFHACFIKDGKEDVLVITFNKEVQELIIGYNDEKRKRIYL